ncbi:MSHA biogenesis protein MshM OS=Stutzerimonas stutzeri OX=316 GN=A9A72_122557 PE=4 SV=1 [Stutzerimonas stutzeri]
MPNPSLSPLALRQALAHELHVPDVEQLDTHGLLAALHARLIELAGEGRSTVLLIDEAQALPVSTLEGLRLLTNLETEQSKLLQVVLFGQPELDQTLARQDLRQLRQRITFSYALRPLDVADATRYLTERLAVAGYRGEPLFERSAVRLLVQGSRGIPRLLNILANKCLMAAFGEGSRCVGVRHVRRALADTEGSALPQGWSRHLRWPLAVAASLAALVGAWPWLSQLGEVLP